MVLKNDEDAKALEIAKAWCQEKGSDWHVQRQLGRGGTAPVFLLSTPHGERAIKIYDEGFSSGAKGEIEEKRVKEQVALGDHNCPYLIKVYEGGKFSGRLFLLMNRAPGRELEKCLKEIPRNKLRQIVGQIAQACIFLRHKGLCHRDIKSANVFISDDYEVATLLDLSVMRNIHDPLGLGTDHGDQLPVVATARYSPPEYLFRLIDPGHELWHAVDIYQLGGLLHDLIMREPLFEAEFKASKENRYRFAWVVATVVPTITSSDIGTDLIVIAKRALDKDWKRRSTMQLEDFLEDSERSKVRALQALGFSEEKAVFQSYPIDLRRHVRDIANNLKDNLVGYLKQNSLLAEHQVEPGGHDNSKCVTLSWIAKQSSVSLERTKFRVHISGSVDADKEKLDCEISLEVYISGTAMGATQKLPTMEIGPAIDDELFAYVRSMLAELAARLLKQPPN